MAGFSRRTDGPTGGATDHRARRTDGPTSRRPHGPTDGRHRDGLTRRRRSPRENNLYLLRKSCLTSHRAATPVHLLYVRVGQLGTASRRGACSALGPFERAPPCAFVLPGGRRSAIPGARSDLRREAPVKDRSSRPRHWPGVRSPPPRLRSRATGRPPGGRGAPPTALHARAQSPSQPDRAPIQWRWVALGPSRVV